MSYSKMLEEFKELITSVEYYNYTLNSLVYWDKITCMPKNAIEYRSKIMAFLANKQYMILSSEKFEKYIKYFDGNKHNDYITNIMVERIKQNSVAVKAIPEQEYIDYIGLIAMAEQVWEEAKENDDYEKLKPYLEKITGEFRKFAEYWTYEKEPYDALLNYYVEGYTSEKVDEMISVIKPVIIEIMKEREAAEKSLKLIEPIKGISAEKQLELWKLILSEIGFDFDAGRVDIGGHTTILASHPDDVRVVNSYSDDDLCVGIFNVLHSGGKGVYQQHIDRKLLGTLLADPPSCAIKEAVGRFYENIIGKSRGFWDRLFPKAVEIIPELGEVGLDNFYNYINRCEPSAIRISADELTYLLHIIIRYELERGLIDGTYNVDTVRKAWNEKYKSYLGVEIKNDREGILQDIHWSSGYFGYFPTYLLSNFAAAQLAGAIEKEYGELNELIREGGMDKITDWMSKNIYVWGYIYNSYELVENACKEEINPDYYTGYLRKKFSAVL